MDSGSSQRRPRSRSGLTRAVGACSTPELLVQSGVGAITVLIGLFILTAASGGFGPLSGLRAPSWVLGLAGGVFLLVGWLFFQTVAGQYYRRYRQARLSARHPGQVELADYPWDLAGSRTSRWLPPYRWLCFTFVLTIFAALGTSMMFSINPPPLIFRIMLWLTNLLVGVLWLYSLRVLWRAIRFRPGFLRWANFPFRPEQGIAMSWDPPDGMTQWAGGVARLQCLEEVRSSTSGSGKHTSHPQHLIRWEGEISIPPRNPADQQDPIPLAFHPDADLPGSRIGSGPPVIFWELEIELTVPGVNPKESHLIPVYRESSPT